jgi:hypothetical protein
MSEGALVSLVAMVGWLVLMIFGYRSYRVDGRKTLSMVMIWLGIFILVILAFTWAM